jgi:hypothetical protein
MNEEIRLTVGVPTSGFVRSGFAHSLCNMMGHLCSIGIRSKGTTNLIIQLEMVEGSVIHTARETIVLKALETKSTHLLFLDDDMIFEADILDTMFDRDVPIVLTNYLLKTEDPVFLIADLNGQSVVTNEQSTGTQVVASGGFGVSLFKMEVFKKTPQPWFLPLWVKDREMYTTEDVPFFYRTRKAGFQAVVDHDASKKITHIGNKRWNWKEFKE